MAMGNDLLIAVFNRGRRMYCRKCGKKIEDDVKFCPACGAEVNNITEIGHEKCIQSKKNKKRKIGIIIGLCLILIIAGLIAALLISKQKKEKIFASNLTAGNKYLEEMNYEEAEASFLKAIKIDSKQKEPYLKLADVYADTEQYEKAEEILKQAEKVFSSSKSEDKNIKKELEEKRQEVNQKKAENESQKNFSWVVEPTIEADNIYYVRDNDYYFKSKNGIMRQYSSPYAVIELNNKLSLIDMEGNLKADYKFDNILDYYGGYMLHSITPASPDEIPENYSKNVEWSLYRTDSSGNIILAEGLGGGSPGIYGYYWMDGLHYVDENSIYSDWVSMEMPKEAFPVKKADKIFDENEMDNTTWWNNLEGKYAICKDSQLVTDFVYDECGSSAGGVLAVCQNGKWGYVNENGETVIPIEFDASWKIETGDMSLDTRRDTKKFCYAADEGYIPLVKDGVWELRNIKNEQIILPGVFEAIRPVYGGKCWVKKNGKWGVIQLTNATVVKENNNDSGSQGQIDSQENVETVTTEMYQSIYGEILDMTYENTEDDFPEYLMYYIYDIDKDGTKELLVQDGTCEADYVYKIYTIKDGECVYIDEISGFHTGFYADENGGTEDYIIQVQGHMMYETLSYVHLIDGQITSEVIFGGQLDDTEEYYSNSYPIESATITDRSLLKQ